MREIVKKIIFLGALITPVAYAQNYSELVANDTGTGAVNEYKTAEANKKDYRRSSTGRNKHKKEKVVTIRDEAFNQLLNKTVPLTPEQIKELHRKIDASQQAVATPANAPPNPVFSNLTVDLSPGATPPVVRLHAGFVTSIVFVDATGQPWAIGDYSLGNPTDFNIQWDNKTNTIFIQSTTSYVSGNLAVRLAGLDTPIMVSLVTGQREVDYRVDLQVRARGPNAAPIKTEMLPNSTHSALLSILDGVPPASSSELKVSGGEGRAWLSKGKLIFRSKLTLLSPAWSAHVASLDGTNVYELSQTPLILASQDGNTVKIKLTGM